jgi:hypothetical protein
MCCCRHMVHPIFNLFLMFIINPVYPVTLLFVNFAPGIFSYGRNKNFTG